MFGGILSDSAVCVRIISSDSPTAFSYNDMSKYIESHPEIMIFKAGDYDQAIEVYLKDVKKMNKFYHLDSGSNFSVSDILEGRKVALIGEDELIFTYTEDNAMFY